MRAGTSLREIILWSTVLLLAGGMFSYYEGVLLGLRTAAAQRNDTARGNWSDLYPRWLGARELLWHGRNPYSSEVTADIQRGFYGRAIDHSNAKDPKDEEAFVYPVYVVFLLAPSLTLPFDAVRHLFTVVILLLTAGSVLLWMRVLGMPLRSRSAGLSLVVAMSSYAVIDGAHLDQITLLIAPLIAASLAALAGGQLFVAGLLLAVASAKPQLALPVVLFVSLWMLGAWRSRKWFAVGFFSLMVPLLIASERMLPGWFGDWRQAAHVYVVSHGPSLLQNWLGAGGGLAVGSSLAILCGWLCWRSRRDSPGSSSFRFALVCTLAVTELALPNAGGSYYNQVLLIPVILWMFTPGWNLATRGTLTRVTWAISFTALAGQWIMASAVSFAALVLGYHFQRETNLAVIAPELLIFIFPLTLALFMFSVAPQAFRAEAPSSYREA